MESHLVVLLVLGATFLVFLTLAIRVLRAVRRAARRAGQRVRHAVDEAALAARSAQPGAVGEAARLRRAVRSSLDGARETLRAGARRDPALREALALLDQLRQHAGQLEGELATLTAGGEPDRARLAARLPELRERAGRITRSADSLRSAAQDRARHDADQGGLDALHRQIEIEASALRHWTPVAPPSSTVPTAPSAPGGPSAPASPSKAAVPKAAVPKDPARPTWLGRRRRPETADE